VRRRLRLLAVIALLAGASLTLAACGGDDPPDPFEQALSYIPADAPIAITLNTDIEGTQYQTLGDLIERFPAGDQLVEGIESSIEEENVNFDEQIRPLLGEEFVIGAPDVEALNSEEDQFVGALPVSDTAALTALIEEQGATEVSEVEGATVYEMGQDRFAVDGSVVVFADTQEQLEEALTQSASGESLTTTVFDDALTGLPTDALVKVYADMPTIIASEPEGEQAQEVPWVGALETLGLTASASEDGLAVDMNLVTNPEGLTDEQLPIAAGTEDPPPVVSEPDEIGIGIRDPSQIARFVEHAADEAGAGEVELAKAQISERLGIDLDTEVLDQLTGEASVTVGLRGDFVGLRSEVEDPDAFEETLRKVAQRLPSAAAGLGAQGVKLDQPSAGSSLYTLRGPDGPPLVLGIEDDLLVAARTKGAAQELAAASPDVVTDATGSVTMRADASTIAEQAVAPFAVVLGNPQSFVEPLGDLTGSLEADTSGLRGHFLLTVE
jgi:hypothetical protein